MIKKDLDGDDLTPPPYWIMTPLPPSAPPGPEAALMPDPGPGEVPAAAAAPLPALPEILELPFQQTLISAMKTSGQHPHDSTSARLPRLYPPLPVSTDGKGEENARIRRRLHSAKEQGKKPHYRCPSETYSSSSSGYMWALPSAPCSLLLPAIFLYGYIKLAETRSTIVWGSHKPRLG